MADLGVHSAADQALVHALSFLLAQGVRDDSTDDALAVLDDVRGRCSRGYVHVAAMADVAGRLVLYGRVRSRGGCEWAMVLREAGRVMQAYHYAGLAAAVRRAGCGRAGSGHAG